MTFDFNWPLFIIIAIAGFLYGEYRAHVVRRAYEATDNAVFDLFIGTSKKMQSAAAVTAMYNLVKTLKEKNLIYEDEQGTMHGYNGNTYTIAQAIKDIAEAEKTRESNNA